MASFEQRAFEGLGNALKAMGYTGESLMKSFDMDGDSVLNYAVSYTHLTLPTKKRV